MKKYYKKYKPYKNLPADTLYNWMEFYRRMYTNYITELYPPIKEATKKELLFLQKYLIKRGIKFF